MAKIVGFHRFALKQGVDAPTFEKFVQEDVFPGLDVVYQIDKTITHEFTKAHWLDAQHVFLRNSKGGEAGDYLWLITTDVDDEKLTTPENRVAVEREAQDKIDEFYTLGSNALSIASTKLEPYVVRTATETFVSLFGRIKQQR